jgi:hypothetical protein
MDEMIRTLLSEPPPSAEATSAARRRLTDEIAARRSARPPVKAWHWSMAAVAAVAAVVAVVLAAGNLGANVPAVAPLGPEATAPELLLAAAHQAATKPAASGRYWRVQIVRKRYDKSLRGRANGETFGLGVRAAYEVWQPKNPSDGTWLGMQGLGVAPGSAKDRAAWERAGSPTEFESLLDPPTGAVDETVSTEPQPGSLKRVESGFRIEVFNLYDPFELAKLPADPDALQAAALDRLKKEGREPDPGLYVMMTELLKFAPATPELRSAAFTVLSRVPSAHNVGVREDAMGRRGIGIELYDNDSWIILDPRDYTFLGYGSDGGENSPSEATAMLKAEWTDDEPVAPALK